MVKEEKVKIVEEVTKKIENYKTIAIFDLFKLPTKILKEVRKNLKGKIEMKIVKKNLLKIALEKSKKDVAKRLKDFLPLQPGIIFSNENWLEILKKIEDMKIRIYAKEGDLAQEDINLKAGVTNLMAGPVIGEFSRLKIPVGVEGGKIAIKRDVTIVKKGERISREMASILRKLEIKPIERSLKIKCLCDDEFVYSENILNFVKDIEKSLKENYKNMISLSTSINWISKDTIKFILIKAYQNGMIINNVIG